MAALAWIVLGPPAVAVVTGLAGRLLGARRSLMALAVSGVIGFTGGVVAAGALTGWGWDTGEMVLLALALGTFFTMLAALVIDLLAPIGTLAHGQAAGLINLRNPIAAVRRTTRPLGRYREVVQLARKNGVTARHESPDTLPQGVRRTLEQAGGIFVKLGQVASTRTDVLPLAWCEELATLRSGAEPVAPEVMRPLLTEVLGASPDELFGTFDWTPIASASMSQVYRATLRDGTPVVVKALRPNLDETVELDAAAVMQLANLIERHSAIGLSIQPAQLAAEFLDNVREELDLRIEAANATELSAALAGIERLRIPAVHPALSGRCVITEELIDAPSVGDLAARGMPADERTAVANRLAAAFVFQIFRIGVFHADPHPGNILLEADGTIVLIDLGAVGRIGTGHRAAVLDMMAAASIADAPSLRQALARITIIGRGVELREVDDAIETFLARHLRAGGGITAAAFEDLATIVGNYGIHLPRWFGTLTRALVTLEGTLRGLDPDFSLVDAARANVGVGHRSRVARRLEGHARARSDGPVPPAAPAARARRRHPRPDLRRTPLGTRLHFLAIPTTSASSPGSSTAWCSDSSPRPPASVRSSSLGRHPAPCWRIPRASTR